MTALNEGSFGDRTGKDGHETTVNPKIESGALVRRSRRILIGASSYQEIINPKDLIKGQKIVLIGKNRQGRNVIAASNLIVEAVHYPNSDQIVKFPQLRPTVLVSEELRGSIYKAELQIGGNLGGMFLARAVVRKSPGLS